MNTGKAHGFKSRKWSKLIAILFKAVFICVYPCSNLFGQNRNNIALGTEADRAIEFFGWLVGRLCVEEDGLNSLVMGIAEGGIEEFAPDAISLG